MRKRIAYAAVALALCIAPVSAVDADAALGDCGQPASQGARPVASDALFTLTAAVGSASCEPCVCDVNDSGTVTASDSLTILQVAVGQPKTVGCPPCPPPACEAAGAPECGGTCPQELTCAPDPTRAGACRCLGPCQLSAAPTCGGSCEGSGGSAACRAVTVATQGSATLEDCDCVPLGIHGCLDADAPSCQGVCPPGSVCRDEGTGSCACADLPIQGACEQADAPACAGTCGGEMICQPDGGEACTCTPYVGQEESCSSEGAPTCGGACASGKMCAVNYQPPCACFSPCELADAPACGGVCTNETHECVPATLSVGELSIDYCTCR